MSSPAPWRIAALSLNAPGTVLAAARTITMSAFFASEASAPGSSAEATTSSAAPVSMAEARGCSVSRQNPWHVRLFRSAGICLLPDGLRSGLPVAFRTLQMSAISAWARLLSVQQRLIDLMWSARAPLRSGSLKRSAGVARPSCSRRCRHCVTLFGSHD